MNTILDIFRGASYHFQSFQGGQDIFIDSMKGPKEIFKKVQKKVQIGQNHHFIGGVDKIFGKFCYLFYGGGIRAFGARPQFRSPPLKDVFETFPKYL